MITARCASLLLALLAIAATPAKSVGFIDLARLVASHPLHAVLLEYDREIAALHSTQNMPGLLDPAATAENAARAQRREVSAGQAVVTRIDSRSADADRDRERRALAALEASRNAGNAGMSAYTGALTRETSASIAAFESATVQRTERAYAARAQQLREKELTLAFDLERQDAGRRLTLELKLNDLHLTPSRRAGLKAALAALDQRELRAVTEARRADASILASYRRRLETEGASANAQMRTQLRTKALANYAQRQRVSQAQSGTSSTVANGDRISAFGATYDRSAEAAAIASGFTAAGSDLEQHFDALAVADRESQRDTSAQLVALESDRRALHQAIVAEILRAAHRVAGQYHLSTVNFAGPRPHNSVDLTPVVKAELIR